jgi:enamine deaminase RidA (YjgF/YER057c/UK114 family)
LYEGAIGTHRPARTTIGVAALPAAALVEIECWVYLPDVAGPEVVLAEEPT